MNLCHRIRKALTIFSPARKPRKSGKEDRGSGVGGSSLRGLGGAGDGDFGGSFPLLKLKEDVQMCGYRDVEVMYSMLRRKHIAAQAEARGRDACTRRPEEKRENKQRSIWKLFLWNTNYSKTIH